MRKPFDALIKGLAVARNRGDWIFTEPKIAFTAE